LAEPNTKKKTMVDGKAAVLDANQFWKEAVDYASGKTLEFKAELQLVKALESEWAGLEPFLAVEERQKPMLLIFWDEARGEPEGRKEKVERSLRR
jgi:hypothetical protein